MLVRTESTSLLTHSPIKASQSANKCANSVSPIVFTWSPLLTTIFTSLSLPSLKSSWLDLSRIFVPGLSLIINKVVFLGFDKSSLELSIEILLELSDALFCTSTLSREIASLSPPSFIAVSFDCANATCDSKQNERNIQSIKNIFCLFLKNFILIPFFKRYIIFVALI